MLHMAIKKLYVKYTYIKTQLYFNEPRDDTCMLCEDMSGEQNYFVRTSGGFDSSSVKYTT